MQNALILTNGLYRTEEAKTAHGLIRTSKRYNIKGVIDNLENEGKDAGELLDGKNRQIPIFANLNNALQNLSEIKFLIIGIAIAGGKIPKDMLAIIKEAINNKLSIVNGLHDYLTEMPEFVELAKLNQVHLMDVRKPKPHSELHFWTGDIYKVKAPIVAVIGVDCSMGKRTTARFLEEMCNKNSIKAEMIYTGQTGLLQGGKYGFIIDSTLNDFVSGELEHAIVSCSKELNPDIMFIEGQSAIRNPSGPCGLELLLSGNAKYVVLIFSPKRIYYNNTEQWGKIPSIESEIELIEKIGSKVIAIALHTEGCTPEEKISFKNHYHQKLNIPVLLPVEEGVENLLESIKNIIKTNQSLA